jgi:hypothetical protein
MSLTHQAALVEFPVLVAVGWNQFPESWWYSYANRTAIRLPVYAHSSLMSR